jgi:hypothetical protein
MGMRFGFQALGFAGFFPSTSSKNHGSSRGFSVQPQNYRAASE